METDTLLSIIRLQQLYIQSLNNLKMKEFFLASEQLEEAYTLFDNVIEKIPPTSPIRDFVIELRDLIIYHLKQINTYIYEKDDIDVNLNSCVPTLDEYDLPDHYEIPPPLEQINYHQYAYKTFNEWFPCCLRYKFKID